MFFNSFISLLLISFSFSVYQVGDQISVEDQARNFDVCYGMEEHGYFEDCIQYTNEDDCVSYNPEPFEDANGDGLYTYAEPFEDLEEPYEDLNENGRWDVEEPYEDLNENGSFDGFNGTWDEGEPYEDLNENGSYDEFDELYDDLYDNNMWDSGFGCKWVNNQCREFPVFSLKDLNGYLNDSGVFYVTMIDMAASW